MYTFYSSVFLIVFPSFQIFSQEEVVSEEVEVTSSETTAVENKSKEIVSFNYIDLVKAYFKNYAHKDQEEILWSLTDLEYRGIKSNEFEYQKIKEAMNDWIFAAKKYQGARDVVHEVQLRHAEKTLDNINHDIYLYERIGEVKRNYRTPFNGNIYVYLNNLARSNGEILDVRSTPY